MSNLADYLSRRVDLSAFQGQIAGQSVQVNQLLALPGQGGQIVAGIYKLLQRWTMEFLTVRGSMPLLPERGCDFLAQLQRGQLRTSIDIEQAFYLSLGQIRRALDAEDDDDSPADEVLENATLTGVELLSDGIVLRVAITSAAGEARTLVMPVSSRAR